MKHSAMHRRLMLEWIHDCADAGRAMPTVAAIVDRFGFAGPEQARTLLADLADAGSIKLTGVGVAQSINLPGDALAPAIPAARGERLPPSIVKPDAAVERVTAMIVALKSRGGTVPVTPIPKEKPVARKPTQTSPSSVDPVVQLLREAGGSIDQMVAALLKRAEDAEAMADQCRHQRPEDAATIEALTKRAETAEGKLAAIKEMSA